MNTNKFLFLDIDGVLTPTAKYTPGAPPNITPASKKVLKKAFAKGFKLVFITARSPTELRENSLEEWLQKENMLDDSLIFSSSGLEQVAFSHEFKTKNNEVVFNGENAVLIKRPVVKRESFGNLDQYLFAKMLLGKEIKDRLKYKGFKIKSARTNEIYTDARIWFEFVNETKKMRTNAVRETKLIVEELKEAFKKTGKFGSPVDLRVYDIEHGISVEPAELGKHIAVLRALKLSKVFPKDAIEGYAYGDSEGDRKMKIRKDIKFIKIKSNSQFVKEVEKIL
jgi:hydroxymethylpyrimidine pyrophosphatase-like HAD family hydrolase